ncbi:glycosyltransferase [Lyngbya aestuarii]|uniref:glycosyltransferase n=1 Tax=Lyngbya aestuarii TaxID=118322 RepID=UPI00403D584D
MNINKPRVSIGLPVYNGDNFLREALDSILAQTFENFELIISDNASTDKTEEICREYAAKDQRVRYYRNEYNLGAAPNYNRVFELATGDYFKWCAHDDLCAPEFLERCVELLEQDASVVLCHTQTKIIDEQGRFLRDNHTQRKADSPKPELRFRELLYENDCFQIFGLIRSSLLRKTQLIESYGHGDGVLLARLGLMGKFHEIPEYLFFNREHSQMSMQIAHSTYEAYTSWFDATRKGKIGLPRWRRFWGYCVSVWETPLSWQKRIWCYRHLVSWLRGNRKFLQEDLVLASTKYLKLLRNNDSLS